VHSALPTMNSACSKSAGGENQPPSACATRPNPNTSRSIQTTNDPISTEGAKLVDIPVLPRRLHFQTGSMRGAAAGRSAARPCSGNDDGVEDVTYREDHHRDAQNDFDDPSDH
jgi:hypothetical protein